MILNRSASILVIDDDPGTCETIGDVLRLNDHDVGTAHRGDEGLARLRERRYDAAIVDIKLPDLSGLELLQAIRSVSADVEVIFITGQASLATAIQAINGAAFAYLVKPFEMDHLLATLGKALEKQRLARALQESEERYRLITESIRDAVFLLDLEGRLLLANTRAEELTGYRFAEAAGQPIFMFLTEDGARQARDRMAAVTAGREVPRLFEAEIVRKDGGRAWVEATLSSVLKEGRVIAHLGVARDVSEQKRLQEQLIQAEKLATLGELIAGIAHELNNPLAALQGHAELLRRTQTDSAIVSRADRILDATQRATQVVRNFLTFARRHRPEKVAVAINNVVTKTVDLLGHQIRVSNIEVTTALTPDLPSLAADPYQLQQVLVNLVNNACQAITGARAQGTIRLATDAGPDRATVIVTVADNGPGIPPAALPRIFDPFFTTKPPGEGTGMGLAIARGIVTEHGGTLTVESAPGGGTMFVMTLPAGPAPPPPAPSQAPRAVPTGLRILVVDDEPAVLELLAEVFRDRGNRVETAANGREALAVVGRTELDALVLDARMPEMTGPDLWARIKETHPALARKTVFCTGDVIGAEIRVALEATGCPTVNKPFDMGLLLDAVARAAAR